MRIGRTYLLAALLSPLLAALLPAAHPALASPLEPPACASLKTEREGLIAAGVKSDMEKGPDWAKTNLAAERLGKIERLIAIEEQLSFRCDDLVTARPLIKEPPKPPAAAPGGEAQAAAPAGAATNADGTTAPKDTAKNKQANKLRKKKQVVTPD